MSQTATTNIIPLTGNVSERIAATGVLLETPTYHRLDRHDVVYGLKSGRVGTAPLARYRLPAGLRGTVLVAPAATNDDGLAILPALAALADRMLPWCPVNVLPNVLGAVVDGDDFARAQGSYEVEGRLYKGCGGLACSGENLILLVSASSTALADALCHEIMHMLWRGHLSEAAIAVLSTAVHTGIDWPGAYFSENIEEKVCRLSSAWCVERLEGSPAPAWAAAGMSVESIFGAIWTGDLARAQLLADAVPGGDAVRRRLGLVLPPPSAPAPLQGRAPIDVMVDAGFSAIAWLAAAAGRASAAPA
jgi:hypothetical protein